MKVFKAKFFFKTRYALKCLSFCFTERISTVTVTEGHAGEGLKPFLSISKAELIHRMLSQAYSFLS